MFKNDTVEKKLEVSVARGILIHRTSRPPPSHFQAAAVFGQPAVLVDVQDEGEVALGVALLHAGGGEVAVRVGLVVAANGVSGESEGRG